MRNTIFFVTILLFWQSQIESQATSLRVVTSRVVPYHYTEESSDEIVGFGVEVIKEIFLRMGDVRVEDIRLLPWKRSMRFLQNSRADMLFFANKTKEREKFFWYSDKVLDSPWVLWIRESGCCKYDTNADLMDRKVGVVNGYSYTKDFWAFIRSHHIADLAVNNEMNFRKLMAHRVDYVAAELGNGTAIVRRLRLPGVVPLLNNPIKTDGLFVLFNKQTVSFSWVRNFSKHLNEFKKNPKFKSLYEKFFNLK